MGMTAIQVQSISGQVIFALSIDIRVHSIM